MELFSSWTGSDFLLFYSVLLVFAVAGAWWMTALLREPGRRGRLEELESVSLLTGGPSRLTDSVLVELYVHGALAEGGKGKLMFAQRTLPVSAAGKALQAEGGPLSLAEAKKALRIHADRAVAKLQRAGLLMRDAEYARLRWMSVTPFAALLLLGLYRQRAGDAVGEPTGWLVALLALTVICAAVRFITVDPRTAAGVAAVRELRARHDRAARAPLPDEAALAVALFGTAVLIGTPWESIHAMRKPEADGGCGGSGDGEGGGDGGSGCGGGGCGGCGG